MPRSQSVLLTLGALVLVLAGCTAEPDVADREDDQAAGSGADESVDIAVGTAETDLGEVLVDAEGRTLYVFDPDEQGSSTCYDDCEEDWPPLIGEEPVAAEGADEGLIGTSTREDERQQVTYDDWPLYHWSGDSDRGDVNGHGVGGVWWTIGADGEPNRDTDDDADTDGAGY